jgi:hypothetical protein
MEIINPLQSKLFSDSLKSVMLLFLASLGATFTISYYDEGHYKMYNNIFTFIFQAPYSMTEVLFISLIICTLSWIPFYFLNRTPFFQNKLSLQSILLALLLPFMTSIGLVLLLFAIFS